MHMKTDWKTIYCVVVSLLAFVLVSLTTSDMYRSRLQADYWKTRYDLLVGLLIDDKFDPDLVPNIEARLWAREEVRARAYTYLARWAQTEPSAEASLNSLWQIEPDDHLRELAEVGLRRPK